MLTAPPPAAGLIQGRDDSLYGTTEFGGTNNQGTVFKMTLDGSSFTTLHSFTGPDGGYPVAALIQGSDGNLYGTTVLGGINNQGTVFKMTPDGTSFTTLHSFTGPDGSLPYAALIQGSDGNFYGTTRLGGANGFGGTVFRMSQTPAEMVLELIAMVNDLNTKQGIVKSLDSKLQNAEAALTAANAGDRANVCNLMSAFINETTAQSGKAILPADAQTLINIANQIRNALGCS